MIVVPKKAINKRLVFDLDNIGDSKTPSPKQNIWNSIFLYLPELTQKAIISIIDTIEYTVIYFTGRNRPINAPTVDKIKDKIKYCIYFL